MADKAIFLILFLFVIFLIIKIQIINYLAFYQSENAKIEQNTYILAKNDMPKSILGWAYTPGDGRGGVEEANSFSLYITKDVLKKCLD